MPLARLENFLKNLNGNTLYVDPNELDATDSIENRGNSKLRPFKTIQRALLEAARFSYVAGSNNDLFDQTTIMIAPGTHYIDNRPGYYVDSSNNIKDINSASKNISEFNILSNFDLTDATNELFVYNSVDGGVILPKGTSLVASDLRKTKIRPLFVPDPAQDEIEASSIFRLTGSCYFFGFTIYDGDPLGKVYNTYSTNTVTPSFSHHKLTAFEYADGVNDVIRNGSNTGHTDLEMYYYKVALGFGQQSGRSVIDGYANLQPNIDEYRIVGDLGTGEVGITSVRSGDGTTGTTVITVTTEVEHELSPLTPILISGVGIAEGSPTTTEYNGNFIVAQVLSETQFTYVTNSIPSGTLLPSTNEASVKVISDTTTSSSPYVFNCSLKSVYGMNGLHADGSKATGFRSIVTAQFTGISLQKDDRAFVKYDEETGTYLDQTSFGVEKFLHQDIDSVYKPDWSSFHIKASNDSFIQCVSIFAIGYANQFLAESGGDQSITNSNSNFGQRALFADGFKASAFPKDDYGFITHIIPPKDVPYLEQSINVYKVSGTLPNSSTKIFLDGYNDILNPPKNIIRGYSIGGRLNDKIYFKVGETQYGATITPNYEIRTNISSIDTSNDLLTLASVSGVATGLEVKIISKNGILPDGIQNNQTYFARPTTGSDIQIFENLSNCNANTSPVDIKNTIGLTSNNLYLVSKVSELSSGGVGSPIQWDSTVKNWYIAITSPDAGFVASVADSVVFLKRILDTRSDDDKAYRIRYVIPKTTTNASVPLSGFVFQKSGYPLNATYTQNEDSVALASLEAIRNKNAIIDAYYTGGTATVITKNPHDLRVGNKISIYNLKSSNEPAPIGIGTGTGFNGNFVVASVVDDITFTYAITVNPGTITAGISTIANWLSIPRNCSQSSNFEVPPYTIYNANRGDLPYFTCDQIENHYQAYLIKPIQKYVKDSTDGVYHITLNTFKNIPSVAPFGTTSDYKFGQNLDNLYPITDVDNLNVDPDPGVTTSSRSKIGLVNINDPYLSSTKESAVGFLKDFNLGKRITGFVKSGSNVTVTTAENHGIGGIREVNISSAGTGYVNGTYYDIPLCGGTGSNATVDVVVSGNTPTSVQISNFGSGYSVGDTLTIKGIPGSTNATTVTIPSGGLNFDSSNSDVVQILGATNSGNNGAFVISSVTTNTITFANASGATESSTNAVVVLSGIGYPISGTPSYNATTGITTITTGNLTPHSFLPGNKVIFDAGGLGICTVTSVTGVTTFTVRGDASAATKVYSVGLIPTLKDTNSENENLSTRNFVVYSGYKSRLNASMLVSDSSFQVANDAGLRKGDFVQIENEIMLITRINGGTFFVNRALFGTQAVTHPTSSSIKTISITPVELRRPSILRASGHTFEYTGFGPGNYSTSMPSNQTKVLSSDEVVASQALSSKAGLVVYTGMNSNGEFFIGRKKYDAATGLEVTKDGEIISGTTGTTDTGSFDTLIVNNLIVNSEIDAATAIENVRTLSVSNGLTVTGNGINVTGVSTFNSNLNVGAGASFIGNGTIPVGGIIMWSGTIATIPTGWSLCNGSNGTPDLRNQFVIGASTDASGQSITGVTGSNTKSGGTKDAIVVSHTHTASTNTAGAHYHQLRDGSGGQNTNSITAGGGNLAGQNNAAGLVNLPNIMSTEGAHTHTITVDSTGSSGTNQNLPPYYALAFIMRVS